MTLRQALLAEFDDEMAVTRRVLERVPDSALAWKPHDRTMSLGELATHLSKIPHWGASILQHDGYDLEHAESQEPARIGSRAEIVSTFDRHAAEARRTLVEKTDAELSAPWNLTTTGGVIMSLPRLTALRRFLFNHLVHHRGQLTVYLRMHDVPLPPLYGPTADERM